VRDTTLVSSSTFLPQTILLVFISLLIPFISEDFATGLTEMKVRNSSQAVQKILARKLLSKETCLYAAVTIMNTLE
jgi:hypothetical protein